MIDCNAPTLTLQRGGDSSLSAASSLTSKDGQEKNFSNLLEENITTDEEITEDPIQDNFPESKHDDAAWMTNWLALTQAATSAATPLAQETELTSALRDSFFPTGEEDTESINPDMFDPTKSGKMQARQPASDDSGNLISTNSQNLEGSLLHLATQDNKRTNQDQMGRSRTQDILDQPSPSAQKTSKAATMLPEYLSPGNQGGASSNTPQSTPLKQADFAHLTFTPQKTAENIEGDNKISTKALSPSPVSHHATTIDTLDGIEMIRSRRQGDLTILQLQLNPAHLGRVDARLRMDENQLMVELSTDKQQTAKLLAKDQHLLEQVLEKAGFGGETRLSIHIVERGASPIHDVSSSLNLGMHNANLSNTSEQEGERNQAEWEQAEWDGGSSSSEGDDNRDTPGQESPPKNRMNPSSQLPLERHEYAFGSMRRLIV